MKQNIQFIAPLLILLLTVPVYGQELQDKFFDSNGVRIRYIEQGKEPVVLVHGFGSSIEAKLGHSGCGKQAGLQFSGYRNGLSRFWEKR
ncbi:MAG: hypothetical protein IPG76_04280 [Acidobacteria bacterium]|nr:hypothetical protein [Acidobacteriota bacterium]